LQDNINSMIIHDYDNFATLAKEKIEILFSQDDFINNIIQGGINTVNKKFDWLKIAIHMENIYSDSYL